MKQWIPEDILKKYDVANYNHAAEILSQSFPEEFSDVIYALRQFAFSTKDILTAGGNKSDIPLKIAHILEPREWREIRISGDLSIKFYMRSGERSGAFSSTPYTEKTIKNYIDGHNIDHVKGLGVMARKHGIPIYTTGGTISEIKKMSSVGTIDDSLFHEIEPDEPFFINDLSIDASAIWHDAADPVCYSISDGKSKFSIATDMGNFDDYVVNKLKNSDIMVIEANHDIRMLQAGPYPYYLKQRILGNRGHLSNERSGQLIKALLNSHIKAILLGHLSKENNFEELAYETVKLELSDNEYASDVREFGLEVARRDQPGALLTVGN